MARKAKAQAVPVWISVDDHMPESLRNVLVLLDANPAKTKTKWWLISFLSSLKSITVMMIGMTMTKIAAAVMSKKDGMQIRLTLVMSILVILLRKK